jgi:hypothetical protein
LTPKIPPQNPISKFLDFFGRDWNILKRITDSDFLAPISSGYKKFQIKILKNEKVMSKIKISFSIKFGPFLARIQIAISRT